jgi:phage replication O-like protein O
VADVQLEQGFTRLANSLLEALTAARLPGAHVAVVLAVVRRTFGWRRSSALISIADLVSDTGLEERTVRRALADLTAWGVVRRGDSVGRSARISIAKDFEAWEVGDTSNARQLARTRGKTQGVYARGSITPGVYVRSGGKTQGVYARGSILGGKKEEEEKERPRAQVDFVVRKIEEGWTRTRAAFAAYGAQVPARLTARRSGLLLEVAQVYPERRPEILGALLVHGFMVRHEKHGKGFDPVRRLTLPTICGASRDDYLDAFDAAIASGRRPPFVAGVRAPLPVLEVAREPPPPPPSERTLEALSVVRSVRKDFQRRYARRFPGEDDYRAALRAKGLEVEFYGDGQTAVAD